MLATRSLTSLLVAAAIAFASLFVTSDALGATKVTLKDGTVLEGEISREGDRFIILVVKIGEIEDEKFIRRTDIVSIEHDAEDAGSETQGASVEDTGPVIQRSPSDKDELIIPPGAARIAFIPLHEGVGSHFNKDAIQRSVEMLDAMPEETRPTIVVFHINSGGGALDELEKIVPYIRDHVEPKYRTVAWIESAISAACMTAWVIDEVYMYRKAAIGGCTGYSTTGSGTQAMEGEDLERVLFWMEQVSQWGKKDPHIMRAMQIFETLTCDIDENNEITWYLDDSGEHMVSPAGEVLTFNSVESVKFGLAQGLADSKDELATAMGCNEWVEVGQEAQALMVEFLENVTAAELELSALYQEMQIALEAMNATPERRNKLRHFGVAKRKFGQMRTWAYKRAPSLLTHGDFTENFFEAQQRDLDAIEETLRD